MRCEKQQVLPSSSLYEQYVFSKGEQQKSCLTHMSQSKKGFYIPRSDKVASPTTMMLSTAKNIKLHQKDANQSQQKRLRCYIVRGPACNAWC